MRLLIVEDRPEDALLTVRPLERAGYSVKFERVATEPELKEALERPGWDAVLCDYSLGGLDAWQALKLSRGRRPDLPFIVVSGQIDEEEAVEMMRQGARDYIRKDHLARLVPALVREMREAEDRRLAAQFLRAQRIEGLGALATGIVHDLNNVFAPILMSTAALRHRVTDRTCLELIATVEAIAARGGSVVRQLMTFADGMGGARVGLRPEHVVQEILRLMRATFPKQIRIETWVAPGLWTVVADATQLYQVLLNLCLNARDAMPEGGKLGVRVENFNVDESFAAMHPGASEGPHVMIRVSDTGCGISAGNLSRIFDPFFTTKGPGKGTGLGLSTVLTIVRSHGGFIVPQSELGKGTTFSVHLPAQPGAPVAEVSASNGGGHSRGHGECVLVVDDEPAICEVTSRTLEDNGYVTIVAGDGAEGLARYIENRSRIRAVVVDVMMPFMDGVAMVRALRRVDPELPVVLCSGAFGSAGVGWRESDLAELKIQRVLTKPFRGEELMETVGQMLQKEGANAA